MSTPQLCATNLSSFTNSLVRDLSDDAERARMEEFYLLHLRIEESSNKALTRSAAKLSNNATANVPQSSDSQAQTVGAVATDTLICVQSRRELQIRACYDRGKIEERHSGIDSHVTTCVENTFDYSG